MVVFGGAIPPWPCVLHDVFDYVFWEKKRDTHEGFGGEGRELASVSNYDTTIVGGLF